MKEDFRDIESIEAYYNKQLKGEALSEFEQGLETDPKLRQEVALFKSMLKGIEWSEDEQLKKSIANTHQQLTEERFFEKDIRIKPQASVFNLRRVLAIAASFSLLILAGLFLFSNNDKLSKQEVLATYGNKIAPEKTQFLIEDIKSYGFAATDKGQRDSLANALENYSNGNYELAKKVLVEYLRHYPEDRLANYYLGLSFFELNNYVQTVVYLEPLSIQVDFEEQKTAAWYSALSYAFMETEDGKQEAKERLDKIYKDSTSPYQQDAEALLQWLK